MGSYLLTLGPPDTSFPAPRRQGRGRERRQEGDHARHLGAIFFVFPFVALPRLLAASMLKRRASGI